MSQALARTVALLLVPDAVTADGDERRSLAELRQRLVGRLAGTHDEVVATFSRPELATEGATAAVEHLAGVLAADESLAADLSGLLGDAEQAGQVGANLVLRVRADVLRDLERQHEALAAYDEILRREPDDAGALYWSAVSLRLLHRREDARARLERVRALEVADAEDLVLVAQQFLLLGERDAAASAAAAAMELARRQPAPLPAESALQASEVWSELGEPAQGVAALEPLLAGDGKPDEGEVSAHIVAARLLLMEVGDAARVVDLLGRLEKRMGSLASEPRARMWLGHALNALSRHAEALELFDERLADQVPPALRGWALYGRGVALLETAAFGQAEPVLREAATLLQAELAALAELVLGIALLALRRSDQARELLDRTAAAVADADPVLRGRVALWRAVAWNDDETRLREGLELADQLLPPDWAERGLLAFWQARMLARTDPARALSLLESISSPYPAWLPRMAMTRAIALATLDRPGEALTMLEPLLTDGDALAADERAWMCSMRADLLLRSDQPAQALDALTDVQELALADDELAGWFLGLQARAATALNRRELLDAVLARMAERDAAVTPLAAFVHAETLLLGDDLAGAFALLRTLEAPQDAANPLAWVVAAQARLASDRADVEEALDRAVELDPRSAANPIVRMARAMVAARRGDLEAVDRLYGAQASTLDERLLFHYLRAGALREVDRPAEAIGELDAVEAEARQATSQTSLTLRVQALADKAVLLLRQDDLAGAERAVAQAEAVLATLPVGGAATPLTRMARALLHMKREAHAEADKALAAAGKVAEGFPANAPVAFAVDYLRGVNWMLAGRDAAEDALRCLTAAVRRRPDDLDALDALGEAYLMVDEPAAALDAFATALSAAGGAGQTASLLRGMSAAQRRSGYLEAAVKSARDAASLEPGEARNWLSLGAAQLELGRHDAAEIAFRRGWRLRPRPPDRVATQLLLGLTKALLDGDRADDALEVLEEPLAGRLAEHEHLVQRNRAVALVRLRRHGEAIEALVRAGQAETAEQLRAARSRRDSWLGFWFGAEVAPTRRRLGALLVAAALLALVPVVVNPERAGWLGWVATGNIRPLVPLAAITLLFLLPVVTRIKLGDVEIEQPAAAAPTVTELQAVSWDAVERKVKSVSTARIVPESTGALPRAEPAVAPPASITVSSVVVVAGQQHSASS